MGPISDTVLHARFVRALPAQYDHAKETLQSMKNRDRDEIVVSLTSLAQEGHSSAVEESGVTLK